LLAQQVVREFPSRVRFVVEDLGASALADRYGIDKYPAVFVDDALVARPEDFYGWGSSAKGRYMPWSETANKDAFRADLRKFVSLRLEGSAIESVAPVRSASADAMIPPLTVVDLSGRRFDLARTGGKPRLIEVWATWCPPCLESLPWLDKLPPTQVSVVTVAVESKEEDVRKLVRKLGIRAPVVMATKELRDVLGGPPAVPTLILTNGTGRVVKTFYGAPPDLHEQVERALALVQ
jgi:cytochrome c biogenesis protein CcmG/thiol:disulfide interchange protein DsbE